MNAQAHSWLLLITNLPRGNAALRMRCRRTLEAPGRADAR